MPDRARITVDRQRSRRRLLAANAYRRESHGNALDDAVGAVQQNVSEPIAILYQAHIVRRRKEGTRVDRYVVSIIDSAAASLARQSDELAKLTTERPA